MKKFYIKTQGCKTNQLEGAIITEKLEEAGYQQTQYEQDADFYILNSCSVTENADNEALRILRHIKSTDKSITTVLTGCVAQLACETIKKHDYIDILLGNNDKFEIAKLLEKEKSAVTDIFSVESFNNQTVHKYFKTRGYLKIQDGCNNYCSYCTIPFARGKSRSNSIDNIIEQVKIYSDAQIKEVVLTGIHIGQWGSDINSEYNLQKLLEKIEETNIPRYRLGSLNTLEITDNLLNFLAGSKKFCPHFHLSLQSLNDKILNAMNRHYNAAQCLDLIDKINSKFNIPFIGSDIIVGFPGETEEDFFKTYENAKKSSLSAIHVFPYSVRKNTAAEKMQNHVELNIKKERAAILQKLAKNKTNEFIKKNINTHQEILVEKRLDKKSGLLKGVTKNYLNVFIDSSDQTLCNTIQNVKIVNKNDEFLFCTII